ncbi:GAF domain-containing protein [Mucilaginibacter daejeonensis]|uniref:GAF domain-containing protein n=1 Tax=Mucilaginibacter daejeonensis TaxID=398049 RepID=UPI001D179F0E|nr:GAF domain-containing protein [Mucilaginibacter daejeonensis]UEG52120.1 GAF domain-containing protein [Mucilaginibacter daejeonensis]
MPQRELERLRSVNRFLKLEISKDAELERIVKQAAEISGSPIAMITFMTDELQHVRYRFGTDLTSLTYDRSFCKEAILQDDLYVVENASTHAYFCSNPFVANEPNIRFYAGAPLTTGEGDKIGTVCVYDHQVKTLTETQKRMLKSLSKQIVHLLEFDASLQLLKEEFIRSKSTAITLRSFFDASSSCHLLLDREMRIVAFNKALNEVTFAAQGKHLKEGGAIIDLVHPQFKAEYERAFDRAITGETVHVERDLMYSLGRICWYMTFEPAYDIEGKISGVSFNAVNITGRVEQEELVREQRTALQKIREIEVSELRTPGSEVIRLLTVAQAEPYFFKIEEGPLLAAAVDELKDKMLAF